MSDPTSAHASRPSSVSGGTHDAPSRASGAADANSLRSSRSSSASSGVFGAPSRAPSACGAAHANSLRSSRSSSASSGAHGAAQAGSRRSSLVGSFFRAASQKFVAGASATDAIDEVKDFDRAVRASGATEAERQSALARLSSVTAARASRVGSPANEPARLSAASSVSSRASTVARHSDADSPGRGATGVPPIVESDSSMITARSEQVGRLHDEVKAMISRVTSVEARSDALGADVKEHEASMRSLSERVSREEALRRALSASVDEQRAVDDGEFRDLRDSITAVGDKVKAVANDLDRRVDKVAREMEHVKLQAAKKPDDRVERLTREVEGLRSLNAKLEARLEANENEVRSLRSGSSRDSTRAAVDLANGAIDDVRSTTVKLDDRLGVLENLVLSEPWTVAQQTAQDALRATRSASRDREASERSSQRAAQQVMHDLGVRMTDLETAVAGLTTSLKVANDTVARVRKEALADVNKLLGGTHPGITTRSRTQSVTVDDDDLLDRLDRLSRRVNELPDEMKSTMLDLIKADREHLARKSEVDAVRLELEQRDLAATATGPTQAEGIPFDFERLDGAVATLKLTTDRRIDDADAGLRALEAKQTDLQREFDNFKARQQQQTRLAGQARLMGDDDGKRALERVTSLSEEFSSHKLSVVDRLSTLELGLMVDDAAQPGELPADARQKLASLEETCQRLDAGLTELAVLVDAIEPATIAADTVRELIAEHEAEKTRPLYFCDTTIWTERVKTLAQLKDLQKRALAVLSEAKSSKKALVQNTKFAFEIPSQANPDADPRETTQYTIVEHLEKSCEMITVLVQVAGITAENGVLRLSSENAQVLATEFVRIAILQTAMIQERDPVRLKEQVKKFMNLHGHLTANDFEKICTDEVQPNSWKPKADAQTTIAKRQGAPAAATATKTTRGRTPSPKRSATPARRTAAAVSSPEFDAVIKSIRGKVDNGKRVTLSRKQAETLVSGSNEGFGRGSA